jgi:hypothetical protein
MREQKYLQCSDDMKKQKLIIAPENSLAGQEEDVKILSARFRNCNGIGRPIGEEITNDTYSDHS